MLFRSRHNFHEGAFPYPVEADKADPLAVLYLKIEFVKQQTGGVLEGNLVEIKQNFGHGAIIAGERMKVKGESEERSVS